MGTPGVRGHRAKVAMAIGVAAFIGMGSLAAAAADRPTTDGTATPPTVEPEPTGAVAQTEPAVPPADQEFEAPSPDALDEPHIDAEPPEGDDIAEPATDSSDACLTHGERVSEVARSTPPGAGHGAAVSAAAHDHEGECVHDADGGSGDEPPSDSAANAQPSTVPPAPVGPYPAAGEPGRSIRQQGHSHGNGDGHTSG